MGHKQSKNRKKELQRPVPSLYPSLTDEFSAYVDPSRVEVDYRSPPAYEACLRNTTPNFQNGQSYYNPSAPSAPSEGPEITGIGKRSSKQEEPGKHWDLEKNPHKLPCPNAKDGCKLNFTAEEMKVHVKECLFMVVSCPLNGVFGTCAWRDKVKNITTHFRDVHPSNIGHVDQEAVLDSSRIIHLADLVPAKFLLQIKVDIEKGQILMAVQHYSTQVCASKWIYEFVFERPGMKYEPLKKACITAGVPIGKKFNNLQCRVLKDPNAIEAFRNGALKYKYRIMKREKAVPRRIEGCSKTTATERKDVVPKKPPKANSRKSKIRG